MLHIDIETLAPNFGELNVGVASRLSNDVAAELYALLDDLSLDDVEELSWVN